MALSITLTDEEATNYISDESKRVAQIKELTKEIYELKAENSDLINSFHQREVQLPLQPFCTLGQEIMSCSTCRFCSPATSTEPPICHNNASPIDILPQPVSQSWYCSLYEPTQLTN